MLFTIITFIIVFILISYDNYLYERGRFFYSVIIGIKGDDDSIEDVRLYANSSIDAKYKALHKYSKENEISIADLIIFAIERL